jgi:hypothetical protein
MDFESWHCKHEVIEPGETYPKRAIYCPEEGCSGQDGCARDRLSSVDVERAMDRAGLTRRFAGFATNWRPQRVRRSVNTLTLPRVRT